MAYVQGTVENLRVLDARDLLQLVDQHFALLRERIGKNGKVVTQGLTGLNDQTSLCNPCLTLVVISRYCTFFPLKAHLRSKLEPMWHQRIIAEAGLTLSQ